jgi:hypothetical protein
LTCDDDFSSGAGLTGAGHDRSQIVRIIGDPNGLQMLAGLSHPYQHRPASVQIHPDDLLSLVSSTHRGLLESLA